MKETITRIEEGDYDNGLSGYKITTTNQEIKLLMDMEGQCCERYGYFMTEDDVSEFIGATVLGVNITDSLLNTIKYDTTKEIDDEAVVMFATILTDRGSLQFVAYNSHNGYYGHTARVISNQLNHSETL